MKKYVVNLTIREALSFITLLVNLKELRAVYVKTDIRRNEDNAKIRLTAEGPCIELLDAAFADGGALSHWREKFKKI